jgi:hypothetical protein
MISLKEEPPIGWEEATKTAVISVEMVRKSPGLPKMSTQASG